MEDVPVGQGQELFGFKIFRTSLWEHAVMARLGLTLLPTLADTNIYAEDEESLAALEKDITIILGQLAEISTATGWGEKAIVPRCQNALHAVHLARELGGGVVLG